MSLNRDEVAKIARLARLRVAPERQEAIAGELSKILDWIEQLNEVDTETAAPMTSVVAMRLKTREDEVTDGGIADDVLANAPEADNGYFVVPKVID